MLRIEWLIGHPLARNAGDLLVEHAVDLSSMYGFDGKLLVQPDPGADQFYDYLGFLPADNSRCMWILDPADAAPWTSVGNSWRYIGGQGPKFRP